MMLIVGLGNPGVEYSQTRHNIGFMILDAISAKYRATFNLASKFKADIAQMQTGDQKIILVKPNTYMNLSGQSVSLIKNYYKIDLSDIVVIHDDLDLKFAEVKIKHGGSAAGHRGLISIDGNIGKEYSRVRVGIGRPENGEDVSDYVLSNFYKVNVDILSEMIVDFANNIDLLVSKSYEDFVHKFAYLKNNHKK